MDGIDETLAITRRFLQGRRRGPLQDEEITALLHPEAELTEVIAGQTWTVVGAPTIAGVFRRFWSGLAVDAHMSVVRQWPVDEHTVVAEWRRTELSKVVEGRDTYTLTDGMITHILVEEFGDSTAEDATTLELPAADLPTAEPLLSGPAA